MDRRKFFTRMSQGVASAVLVTHLSFGNLVPIPEQHKVMWGKLFTVANADGSLDLKTAYATDAEIRAIEEFPHFACAHKDGDSFVSYYPIEDGHYLMGQF
jgi:hypothetical protein